jgi:hypothetical protein
LKHIFSEILPKIIPGFFHLFAGIDLARGREEAKQ